MDKVAPHFVVIGGGTGSFTLLNGLKSYASNVTALVNMADDGGSTGQLRDEFGVLPPGDVRQCLVALSDSPKVRDLFNYRFEEGALEGHAFGNLFLTALEKMTGSFAEAVELASEVLNVSGKVEPITLTDVTLCSETEEGTIIKGQANNEAADYHSQKIKLWLEPKAELNPKALAAIQDADVIVVAPGNLYTSLAPALIVPGLGRALKESKAKKVYVSNLVTKPGQTDGYKVDTFAAEIERLAGEQFLTHVVYNTNPPSADLLDKYAKDGEFPVAVDEKELAKAHYRTRGVDLLASEVWNGGSQHDPLAHTRTYIRHDSDKIARQIMRIHFS